MTIYTKISSEKLDLYRSNFDCLSDIDNDIRNCARMAQRIFSENRENLRNAQIELENILNDLKKLYAIKKRYYHYVNSFNNYEKQVELLLHYIGFTIESDEKEDDIYKDIESLEKINYKIKDKLENIFRIDATNFQEEIFDKLLSEIEDIEKQGLKYSNKLKNLKILANEFIEKVSLQHLINFLPSTPLGKTIQYQLPNVQYSELVKRLIKPNILFLKKWHVNAKIISESKKELELYLMSIDMVQDELNLKEKTEYLYSLYEKIDNKIFERNKLIIEAKILEKNKREIQEKIGYIPFDITSFSNETIQENNIKNYYLIKKNFLEKQIYLVRSIIKEQISIANSCHASQQGIQQTCKILETLKPNLEKSKILENHIIQEMVELGKLLSSHLKYEHDDVSVSSENISIAAVNSTFPKNFLEIINERIIILKKLQDTDDYLNGKPSIYQKLLNNLSQILRNNPSIPPALLTFLSNLDTKKSRYNVRNAFLLATIKFAIAKLNPNAIQALTLDALTEASQMLKSDSAPAVPTSSPSKIKTSYLMKRLAQAFLAYHVTKYHGKFMKTLSKTINLILYPWMELAQCVFNIQNHTKILISYGQISITALAIMVPLLFLHTIIPLNFFGFFSVLTGINLMASIGALISKKLFNNTIYQINEAPLVIKKVLGTARANQLWQLILTEENKLQSSLEQTVITRDKVEKLHNIRLSFEKTSEQDYQIISKLEKEFIVLYYQEVRNNIIQTDSRCSSSQENILGDLIEHEKRLSIISMHLLPLPPTL